MQLNVLLDVALMLYNHFKQRSSIDISIHPYQF